MPWTGFRFPRSLPACVGFYRCRWMRSGMALHFIRPGLPEAAGRRVAMDRADERSVLSLKPHGLRSCSESGLDVGEDSTTTYPKPNRSRLGFFLPGTPGVARVLALLRRTPPPLSTGFLPLCTFISTPRGCPQWGTQRVPRAEVSAALNPSTNVLPGSSPDVGVGWPEHPPRAPKRSLG